MNCQEFEDIVTDLGGLKPMEASVRDLALVHSRGCESCALRLSNERLLTMNLRMLIDDMRSIQASDRVEEHLRLEFRSQKFTRRRPTVRRQMYWATAAAVVVLVGLGLLVTGLQRGEAPREEVATEKNVQEESFVEPRLYENPLRREDLVSTLPFRVKEAPVVKPARSRGLGKMSANEALRDLQVSEVEISEYEIATDFLPVGYGSSLNLQDGGQLVRVELPRAALLSFGLPVNMTRANERVKADVVIGTDGLARAIRFVH